MGVARLMALPEHLYLRAYQNIRHNEIFSECGKCPRGEATTQENLGYHLAWKHEIFRCAIYFAVLSGTSLREESQAS